MGKRNKTKRQINFWLLPLWFILAVLPLILDLYIGSSGYGVYPWNSEKDSFLDVFLQGKMVMFQVIAVIMLLLAGYKTVTLEKEARKQMLYRFCPLVIYAGLVLLSTIVSDNISYSVSGAKDAWEPVGVLIGYVVTVVYACLVLETAEDVKQVISAAVIGGGCMAVLGVLQAIGKDPLATEGVQRMFVGSEFISQKGLLNLTFPVGMAYGTLYNPNYVGTYVSMYLPLAIIGIRIYQETWKKAASGLVVLGLLVTLFASQSRTGLIAVAAAGVVAVLFLGRIIVKRWYVAVAGIVLAVLAFWGVVAHRDYTLTNRILEMLTLKPGEEPVLGVDTTGTGVRVVGYDTEYTVMMPVFGTGFSYVAFEGDKQKEVSYNEDKSYGYFSLDNGTEIEIQTAIYEEEYAFGLKINDRKFYFTNQLEKENYKYINELYYIIL